MDLQDKLPGQQCKSLHEALVSAYPGDNLKRFVRFELEENLAEIVGGENFNDIVFNLIGWAESQGKLKKLIESAYQANPGNEKLRVIKEELFPSIYAAASEPINSYNFPENHWNDLRSILDEIELNLLARVCRNTLENITKQKDISGNYLELQPLKKIGTLKNILLKHIPLNDRNIPTVIEFAERLAKEQEIEGNYQIQLNQWLRKVAEELQVKLPSYSESKSKSIVQSYLLIIASPKGNNQFSLTAELFCDYNQNYINNQNNNNNKTIKIELEQEKGKIDCSWNQIIDKVSEFISISKNYYLNKKYEDYNLTIELLLPLPYLHKSIDIEEIPVGFGKKKSIANEYQFIIRSLERITESNGDYLRILRRRWDRLNSLLANEQNQPTWDNFSNEFEHFPSSSNNSNNKNNNSQVWNWDTCTWDEYVNKWDSDKRLGLKISCNLPENDEEKQELFIAIIRAGVPISLWTRCCHLSDIDSEFNEIFSGKSEFMNDANHLFESVWRIRKKAHGKKEEERKNYLGYHLGFLCDNPYRIPFSLMEQNQPLIETGY